MDLVKIGFQINANGLKDANTEVDKLLDKVDNIGTKGKKASSEFESSQKKVQDSVKKTEKVSTSASDKMIQKQQTLNQLLPYMDRNTANLASSFWLVSKEAQSFNKYLDLLESNKAITEQKKQVEGLAKEQAKASASEDVARQKRLLAEQNYYLRVQEEAKKAATKEKALQQKAVDDAEKARQQSLLHIQNNYIKQQEAIAKAQQKAVDKQIASQNALNASNQKAITLEQAKAKYVSQGYGKTDSTRLARLEVSGADVTTLNNYKSAIEATTRATQALNPAVEKVTTSHSNFLDQVKGIAIYAALSAAIYGVMTAMTNLAVATVKMADEYTSIQNRMKLYITDAKELGKVNSQLAQFSMENNVGLKETATLFSRLAPSMQKLGANTAAITTVVDAFGKSMRIGGATAMEAASATIQFSQAMASGKLAGDEFRSISEASPRFLKAIAEGSGIAADKLKEMSAAGMLTTQVISKALLKEYPKLIEENKKLGVTMEQGANAIKTGFLVAIGEFNEGAGITKALGEAMLDLAQGMLTGAQNARQFGKDINDWFSANAGTINTVVDAFKLLATVIASKYVASMLVAGAISLKTAYNMNIAALGATALQRAFGVATIASLRLGSALASLATPKNLFTLGLTVAGVATAYLLLRDNAAEASKKIVESSEYADMTTNSFKQLNAEQQKNARASLIKSMSDVNEKLDEQANTVNRVLLSYVQLRQMQGKMNNKQLDDVINKTTKGLMDYDTAYRKLLELGAPTDVVEEFKKQKDVYNETAKSAKTLETSANAAGAGVKLAGNEAQNATPAINGLKDKTKQLGEEAIITGSKFNKMADDFKKAAADSRATLAVMKQYNLDATFAEKLVKSSQARFNSTQGNIDSTLEKIKAAEKLLNSLDKNDPSRASVQATLDKAKASLKVAQEAVNLGKQADIRNLAPLAQDAQNAAEDVSDLTASRKKSEKDEDKLLNKSKKITEAYQEQVEHVTRLQGLLASGLKADAAKIAAEKDYAKTIIGTSLAVDIAEANRQLAITEHNIALEEEQRILAETLKLMNHGATLEQARTLAQAGYLDDALGALAVEYQIVNELEAKRISLIDQARTQKDINFFLAQGLNLEQAITEATFARLKFISGGLSAERQQMKDKINEQQRLLKTRQVEQQFLIDFNKLDKQRILFVNAQADSYSKLAKTIAIANKVATNPDMTPAQAARLVEAEELLSFEKEMSSLKMQTYIATLNESDAVKQLLSTYTTLDSVQIGQYDRQQKILAISKELSAEAEKQRNNPLGDFSNISFDVFGDIGNPFEVALNGLNEFLARTQESRGLLASLEKDITSAKQAGLDITNLELEKNQLLTKQEQDRSKAVDQGITNTLSLTKYMFNEESKGYKVVSKLEKAYQASKIAFALWEKKDTIAMLALELKGMLTSAATFVTTTATKMAAQLGFNVAKGTEAVLTQGSGDPYTAFPRMAAMAAAVAALGVAIGSFSGGSSSTTVSSNTGTGTVFGDSEAQSASIANSIDILSDNSDLMLPLTSAMLASLKSIESSIGGITNLIVRGNVGNSVTALEYDGVLTGIVGTANNLFAKFTNGLEKVLTVGILSKLGVGGLGTSIVSSLLGGLFGKTSQKVTASGLYAGDQTLASILSNGLNLKQYADVKTTKKSWFSSSSSTSTKYAEADEELQNQFTLVFSGFYDSILSATDILGADLSAVQTNLENAVISIGKIDLKDLDAEEIQEKLEAVFGAAADDLAKQAFGSLEDFQSVGEGYYETLVKVASAVEEAAYYTDRFNVTAIDYNDIINKQADDLAAEIIRQSYLTKEGISTVTGGMSDLVNSFSGTAEEISDFITTLEDLQEQLFMTGQSGDYLTSSMILGAGGLDSLASGLDAYFEMLSPAEQAAELTRRLTNEFDLIGQTLPSDVKAFRALVNSIDITTEAGQKLYGQIIALAPEFNDLQDALESANSDINELVESLRDLAEQAREARGETETTRNLDYLRNEFQLASVLALQGDVDAAERLVDLGASLIASSKLYSVTGSDYAKDLAYIQGISTAVANLQEASLGTSTTTTTDSDLTLTTATSSSTSSSTDSEESAVTTELQALREEMNAALLAIAKYTQTTATKLESWDDGNRMMVGIQPENGDTPVPVVVAV